MTIVIKKYKFVIGTVVFATVLLAVIIGLFSIDNATNQMVVDYVQSLGWEINPSPTEISHLTIPNTFDAVYETYNCVQLNSGFDLSPYKGKGVSRYCYQVFNHKESKNSEIIVAVLVYENRIIAGDISSTAMNGFMHGITEVSNISN